MAGIEALAAGVPVVTTDVGDCRDLAVDAALVARPRDPESLARCVRTVLESPDAWGERASALAQARFSIESTSRAYRAIYKKVSG